MANFLITIIITAFGINFLNSTYTIPAPQFVPKDVPLIIENNFEIKVGKTG